MLSSWMDTIPRHSVIFVPDCMVSEDTGRTVRWPLVMLTSILSPAPCDTVSNTSTLNST